MNHSLFGVNTYICIGTGPSLSRGQLNLVEEVWSKNRDKIKVIAINNSIYPFPRADILFAADRIWWKNNINELNTSEEITGRFCTLNGTSRYLTKLDLPFDPKRFTEYSCLPGSVGLNLDGHLNHGGNSGHMAINLAYNLGAKKIILIGYDYQHTFGRSHWFGDYPEKMYNANASNTEQWVKNFKYIANDLNELRIDLVNCSQVSAIESCLRGDLLTELSSIL